MALAWLDRFGELGPCEGSLRAALRRVPGDAVHLVRLDERVADLLIGPAGLAWLEREAEAETAAGPALGGLVEVEGVDTVVGQEYLVDALVGADVVFLAVSLTPETIGLIGKPELEVMEPHAWLINVARGGHIVTEDLVWALQNNVIGGAALDVTDPEPLPENHPLWTLPNCIITPHVGNTPEMAVPLLSARITENVKRFINGEELIGLVDIRNGY